MTIDECFEELSKSFNPLSDVWYESDLPKGKTSSIVHSDGGSTLRKAIIVGLLVASYSTLARAMIRAQMMPHTASACISTKLKYRKRVAAQGHRQHIWTEGTWNCESFEGKQSFKAQ
jgi:hypothetical protein